jgi:hypothetical protein
MTPSIGPFLTARWTFAYFRARVACVWTSGNTIRGWELFSICCGLFVPSRALGPYLVDFLTSSIQAEDEKLVQETRFTKTAVLADPRFRPRCSRTYTGSHK